MVFYQHSPDPVGIVIAIIAALAAGFIALYKTNDEFKEKVDGTIGKVKVPFRRCGQPYNRFWRA